VTDFFDDIPDSLRESLGQALDATAGAIAEDGIAIEFAGACPVQGFGEADGHPIYYRSRHGLASLEVYPPGTDEHDYRTAAIWSHEEDDAGDGWTESAQSAEFIRRAVAKWRAER
jgi:hypothetical protein